MDTVVVKFGGTSVATEESRARAVAHVAKLQSGSARVVAVVSAMGRKGSPYATDTLLSLLSGESNPAVRDLLMSCGETISACVFADALEQSGIKAAALTGMQAGILTDSSFGMAEIFDMNTLRIWSALHEGRVPVITGFQGANVSGEVTTLGRGGSDTSAVAIGGFLRAKEVIIYTDVPGVAVIDPRIIPEAPFFEKLSPKPMRALAFWGAGVIHPRAVKAADRFGMDVWVRSTFDDKPGTRITEHANLPPGPVGIACLRNCRIEEGEAGERTVFEEGRPFSVRPGGMYTLLTVVFSNWEYDRIKEAVQPITQKFRCFFSSSCAHVLALADDADKAARELYGLLFEKSGTH